MGFFGRFVYRDGHWTEGGDTLPASPYLRVEIHDSDFAQIDYAPADVGRGRFYLGFAPASYFEDPSASAPVDARAEARGFSLWADQVLGVDVASDRVLPLLADPEGSDPEDPFVEAVVVRLLQQVGLPLPPGLSVE